MNKGLPNAIERQTPSTPEKNVTNQESSPELKQASEGVGLDISEVVEDAESGEVSERNREDKKSGSQGTFASRKGDQKKPIQLKPLIFPKIEIMQIQIATAIHKEIITLEKEADKVKHDAYALTGVVAKIRELKYVLANLTHATIETLKNWWMKFVKKPS